ncbi:MAG: hypothetical protein PHP03_01740 [Candidatus Pacebacteria bacterium]|nr:hypothetical protein [Candidatus Paceibacterota bacterium]
MLYILTLLTIILLTLSSIIFNLWFLVFAALVPYFYFLNKDYSKKKTFFGGFIVGVFSCFGIIFPVLYAHPIIWVPICLTFGILFGLGGLAYRKFKQGNIVDIFIFAAIWTLAEWLAETIFQNFYYGALGYTAHNFIPLLSFASIGGIFLISFIIAAINGFIGWGWIHRRLDKKFLITISIFAAAILGIYWANYIYLNPKNPDGHFSSFSIIQIDEKSLPYGKIINGNFIIDEKIKNLIQKAVSSGSDYIVYPYSFVKEALIFQNSGIKSLNVAGTFEEVGKWLKSVIPPERTLIFWPDMMREQDKITDEVVFWKDGKILDYYQKRILAPLRDYTVATGVSVNPYDYVPAEKDEVIRINNDIFGNLSCSEINQSFLARRDSDKTNITLFIGYSDIFEDYFYRKINLASSQIRAAENNLPLIRSDIYGPSAFIDKQGKIISNLGENKNDILIGKIFVESSHRRTLYSRFGDAPLIILLAIFLGIIGFRKRNKN